MKDCKYRLPCNWCDKLNKYCDMVEPIEIDLPDPYNCDHDWKIEHTYMFPPNGEDKEPYYVIKRVCRKCHESELVKTDMHGNHID